MAFPDQWLVVENGNQEEAIDCSDEAMARKIFKRLVDNPDPQTETLELLKVVQVEKWDR